MAADGLLGEVEAVRDRLITGQLEWLGQRWPQMTGDWLTQLWTLDPVSQTHWPGAGAKAGYRHRGGRGDVKFVWEPNRLQVLQPLALLAAHGDTAATQLGWDILDGWMVANPPYQGVNWSSGIEAASRIVSVLVFLSGAGRIDPSRSNKVRRFIAAHVRPISRYPSLHSSANNHRIAELASLLLTSICAPALRSAIGEPGALVADLEAQIVRQFHPDGVGAEQSPTYTAYSLEWLTLAAVAAEAASLTISSTYRGRLRAASEHLTWLSDEAGHLPRIGDDDEGRVIALSMTPEPRYAASVAAMATRWLGEPQQSSSLRDPALRDFIGAAAKTSTPAPAPSGERHFADGGYTVSRRPTPSGQAVLTVDHGALGFLSIAAHGHADALSILLSWGDEPVLVDAGTFLYHAGGSQRDRMRGSSVHNTLVIKADDQSRIVGPFAWTDHAETQVVSYDNCKLVAQCLGWQRRFSVIHERRMDWAQEGIIRVEDRLIGRIARPLKWTSGLSLAPNCQIDLAGGVAKVTTPRGRNLVLRAENTEWHGERSVYSTAFNKIVEIDRLELRGSYAPGKDIGRVAAFSVELQP
ncbi:MAG: heparinase II/III-family protein [Devosia sp.]